MRKCTRMAMCALGPVSSWNGTSALAIHLLCRIWMWPVSKKFSLTSWGCSGNSDSEAVGWQYPVVSRSGSPSWGFSIVVVPHRDQAVLLPDRKMVDLDLWRLGAVPGSGARAVRAEGESMEGAHDLLSLYRAAAAQVRS